MRRFKSILLAALVLFTQACTMTELPRNQNLKAFDPHRKDFTCKHEASAVPPIDEEAEHWFQQGLALTSPTMWASDRDYAGALRLWQQAADRQHWKAMLNLANAYAHGEGVQRDTERAIQIVESAMKLGVPGAYDLMGTYHREGLGVKQDVSRAYAFWQLAADLGSPSAMAFLGEATSALYDDPQQGFWGNRKIGLKMLECGYAQGNGKAAFELGVTLIGTDKSRDEDNARALRILHDGVKFGSAESASWLSSGFRYGEPLVDGFKDIARAERYSTLSDALRLDPDLRLPNLDKVLPLPPADLPKWNGERQTLIDAAKPVLPRPVAPPKPAASAASQRTGRAHIPEGFALPERPQIEVPAQYETTAAPTGGYWIARLMHPVAERHHAWNAAQWPQHYATGELFDRSRTGLHFEDGRIQFHYLGERVAQATVNLWIEDPRVLRGGARYSAVPQTPLACFGDEPCPETGIWSASVPREHALSAVFNQWHRQAYVLRGQKFPNPKAQQLDIATGDITWQWLANANEQRAPGLVYIRVDEPVVATVAADAAVPPLDPADPA